MTVSDYPDYTTPQAHANAISVTGTPLLHGYNTIIGPSHVYNIPANGQSNTGALIPVSKPGYQMLLVLTTPNTVTVPFATVVMRWFDPSGTVQVHRQDWTISGTVAGSTGIQAQGPTRGTFVQLTFVNLDPAVAQSISVTMMETTHHLARDDWRNGALNNNPTNNTWAPGANAVGNVLAQVVRTTAATETYQLPLYAGQAWLTATFNPTVGGQIAQFQIQPYDQGAWLFSSPGATGNSVVTAAPVTMPRKPCDLILIPPAGGATFIISLVTQEYAS